MVAMTSEYELLTVNEIAGVLKVSPPRAYALVADAGIPHVRLSERRIRIPRGAFERWLTDQTTNVPRDKVPAVAG